MYDFKNIYNLKKEEKNMKSKSVLLILPCSIQKQASEISLAGMEHLGLGYLKSYLVSHGYNATIINFELINYLRMSSYLKSQTDDEYLLEMVKNEEPVLIGISTTLMTIKESVRISRYLKKHFPKIPICFGGPHASVCYEDILKNVESVDYISVGYGEISMLKLVKFLHSQSDLRDIPNLIYRSGSGIIANKLSSFKQEEINNLPFPSRDDLRLMTKYHSTNEARLSTSRGCTGRCTFCCDPAINPERKWVSRTAEDIVSEIEYLNTTYNINYFWINDDNFIPPTDEGRQRAKKVAQEIIKKNIKIKFRGLFRSDTFHKKDDLLPLLKESGLSIAFVGFESGSQAKLKRFNKQVKVEQHYTIVEELKKNNIALQIGFIMFDPFTSFDDLRDDSKFLRDIGEMYLFTNFVQIMDVFPKTHIVKMMIKQGLLKHEPGYESDYRDYKFLDSRVEKMAKYLNSLYKEKIINIDKNLQRLKIVSFQEIYDNMDEDYKIYIQNKVDKLYNNINTMNYNIFSYISTAFEKNNVCYEEFNKLIESGINHNIQQLNELDNIYIKEKKINFSATKFYA